MGVGIIIDLVVIAFMMLCIFYGYKKGLIKVGIHLVSFVIAILVTLILYRPIANFIINNTTIDETIKNTIVEKMGNNSTNNEQVAENVINNAKNSVVTQTADSLSENIIYAGVIILLFLLSRILLVFISALADFISKLPLIEQCDKIGGIIYGIVIGFTIISVILLGISFVEKAENSNDLNNKINQTYITKLLYENNILNLLFK